MADNTELTHKFGKLANRVPINGDLMVYHIPCIGVDEFLIIVNDINEAKLILNTLADYDLYLTNDVGLLDDYSNVSGLLTYDNGDWVEWINDLGDDIWDIIGDDSE